MKKGFVLLFTLCLCLAGILTFAACAGGPPEDTSYLNIRPDFNDQK